MSTFDAAFAAVVGSEGGYVNNPVDPGGETKFGVSKRAYPDTNIGSLTIADAKAIYRRDYWDKIEGDSLHPSLALTVFDSAVNNGVSRAAKWLQIAAGTAPDGIIGPDTLAAVSRKKPVDVIVEFNAQRMRFMFSLPTATTFGLGWARRLAALPFAAMALEPQAVPPPVQPDMADAIEIAVRKVLEDRAFTDALNQRVPR